MLATSTADLTFPSAATMVQAGLGMTRGFAFDVQAVCAGFVFALTTANALILSGQAKRVLVIGAETFSRLMDWTDRSTCVLFGDGAGRAGAGGAPRATGTTADRGILSADLHSDGRFSAICCMSMAACRPARTGHLRMQGKEVFRHAVEKLAETAHAALDKVGLSGERCGLDRAASGQYPHHRGHRPAHAGADGPGGGDGAGPRQHLGRLDPAGAVGGQGSAARSSRAICW